MLLRTVLKDKKGLTLIEVMISLVVLLLVFLALMQTALVSIDSSMKNVLRDEAVNVAEGLMNNARNTPFGTLVAGTTDVSPPPKSIRNIAAFAYTGTRAITDLNIDSKQIVITVTWNWKTVPYVHTISTIVRKQP